MLYEGYFDDVGRVFRGCFWAVDLWSKREYRTLGVFDFLTFGFFAGLEASLHWPSTPLVLKFVFAIPVYLVGYPLRFVFSIAVTLISLPFVFIKNAVDFLIKQARGITSIRPPLLFQLTESVSNKARFGALFAIFFGNLSSDFSSKKSSYFGIFDVLTLGVFLLIDALVQGLLDKLKQEYSNYKRTDNWIGFGFHCFFISIVLLFSSPRYIFSATMTLLVSPVILLIHLFSKSKEQQQVFEPLPPESHPVIHTLSSSVKSVLTTSMGVFLRVLPGDTVDRPSIVIDGPGTALVTIPSIIGGAVDSQQTVPLIFLYPYASLLNAMRQTGALNIFSHDSPSCYPRSLWYLGRLTRTADSTKQKNPLEPRNWKLSPDILWIILEFAYGHFWNEVQEADEPKRVETPESAYALRWFRMPAPTAVQQYQPPAPPVVAASPL